MQADPRRFPRIPFAALAAVAMAPFAGAQIGQNLLANASFESGSLSPWNVVAGSVAVASYGTAPLPGAGVANTVLGGNRLLRDNGGGAVEQIVTPTSIPAGASLFVDGYFGGGTEDDSRVVVRFLDANNAQLGIHAGGYATEAQRNYEAVLLYRSLVVPVPVGTVHVAVRIEFRNFYCCGGAQGAADNLTAELVVGSTVPSAWPQQTELLANPGFEAGWSGGSPLTLVDPRGWEGAGGSCVVKPYSNSDPTVPNGLVSCRLGGALPSNSCGPTAVGSVLTHNGNAAVRQTIDLRGNTPQFASGNVWLHLAASLGGVGGEPDSAQIDFRYIGVNNQTLGTGSLAPVGAAERNYETLLLRREQDFPVVAGTAYLELTVSFADYTCCGGSRGLVDNVSAMLVPSPSLAPVPLNVDLVDNSGFEVGSVPGSPLELLNPAGWRGQGASRCAAVTYGGADTPSAAFATARSLGFQLLHDGGTSALAQWIDLRGSAGLIANGRMAMQASAWLGGYANEPDTAAVRIRFLDDYLASVGFQQVLPPVTAAERQNQTTLLQRLSLPFAVPQTAAYAIVEVVFADYNCCGGSRGLADDVRLVAFDITQQSAASPYPGTGGDLVLMTGVNSLPRTGPGHYVKDAAVGDVLRTVVGSPNGTLDGAPMVLAVNVIPTGQPPLPTVPGLVLDPTTAVTIFNGLGGGAVGPLVIPLSQGGNVWNQQIPPGTQGLSLLVQALCLQWNNQQSSNGLFFGSEGHEIRLQ